MTNTKQKFVIIDGNALLHRAWHALPPLTTKKGEVVNAVYGFMMIFFKMFETVKPEYIAVAWDRREKTFRHQEFVEYKAGREKQPDELYTQIDRIREILDILGIPSFSQAGFEADDLIGTMVKLTPQTEIEDIILTGDMDALQLVDETTKVMTLKKGISDTIIYDIAEVEKKYGFEPKQLIDYKALSGDPSDNIPGVKGVGDKTAKELIDEFKSLENIYQAIDENKTGKIKPRYLELLKENREMAFTSKMLATIVCDVELDFDLEKCRYHGFDSQKLFNIFQELEFKTLLKKIPNLMGEKKGETAENRTERSDVVYHFIDNIKDLDELIKKLVQQEEFAFDTETNSINPIEAEISGLSLCFKEGEAYYISAKPEFLAKLKPILEDSKIKKIGQNTKYDLEVLANVGIKVAGVNFDTMVGAYLLNPGNRGLSLDSLAMEYFGYEMQSIEELIGKKGKGQLTMDQVDPQKVSWYACEDADYTYRLKKVLRPQLVQQKLLDLFDDIEMPLIPVLQEMETNGVKIDQDFLAKMKKQVGTRIKELEKKIYQAAGQEFNVASPKQLKEIIFDKLNVSAAGIKKTKTGYSTAVDELEKLRGRHEIIDHLFEFRELSKLQSTYIIALPKLVSPKTGRIHTSFNQTITATGRLSSSNPNLQNIPVKTDLGRKIRQAFIADFGYKLVAVDYSQIELRIAAHLSGDKKMIESFKNNEDIHTRTAAEINGVELDQVTKEMRRAAKAINFGVLYGMGVYGLSKTAEIPMEDAAEFLEKYFELYHELKDYVDETLEQARQNEFVETMFGRRRNLPEINSSVPMLRNSAARMAVNMPMQGTSADMIKIAMIEVLKFCQQENSRDQKIKLILQVHDELVFEIKKDFVEEYVKKIKQIMEGVVKLKVPIIAELKIGDDWGQMENLKI
ncbi:MAG: DNA polymerase I [Patescibacteria group bacterium]